MPPKRKALADNTNKVNAGTRTTRGAKASKTSSKVSAPEAATATAKTNTKTKKEIKYCNANTLSKTPSCLHLQWPNFYDFIKDKNQDMPKEGQLIGEFSDRVSDLGFPVSEDAMKLCEKLDKEERKRHQEEHGVYMYNDFNGYGMSELMDNYLKDFNRDIFKKTVSPFKKWAYIEALGIYLKSVELMEWIGNDDSEYTKEIINMFGVMILTSYDMLSEHDLFGPESEIKNIGIISLILLEFLEAACDFDCEWGCEVVRLCDEAGIDLSKLVRKQVSVSKKKIESYRSQYKKKKKAFFGKDHKLNGDGYKGFANTKNWKPAMDMGDSIKISGKPFSEDRMWYRWDWALEYKDFKETHAGGKKFDLTKMSRAEKRECAL